MAKIKLGTRAPADPWAQAVEVPRDGLPDAAKLARRWRFMRNYVWAATFLFPVALLAMILAFTRTPEIPEVDLSQAAGGERAAVAVAAVDTWLTSNPAPLPGAQRVAWIEARDLQRGTDPATGKPIGPALSSHDVAVRTPSGARMTVSVLVATDDAGRSAAVTGSPSVRPEVSTDDLQITDPWTTLLPASTNTEITAAITTWAKAYTGTDPVVLRQAVGDPDATRGYLTMPGTATAEATPADAGWIPQTVDGEVRATTQMVVAVNLAVTWPGGDPSQKATLAYDVLLVDAGTAAPRVVAWGPRGTGPTLTPYGNAVPVESATAATAPPEPTVTPTQNQEQQP